MDPLSKTKIKSKSTSSNTRKIRRRIKERNRRTREERRKKERQLAIQKERLIKRVNPHRNINHPVYYDPHFGKRSPNKFSKREEEEKIEKGEYEFGEGDNPNDQEKRMGGGCGWKWWKKFFKSFS